MCDGVQEPVPGWFVQFQTQAGQQHAEVMKQLGGIAVQLSRQDQIEANATEAVNLARKHEAQLTGAAAASADNQRWAKRQVASTLLSIIFGSVIGTALTIWARNLFGAGNQ